MPNMADPVDSEEPQTVSESTDTKQSKENGQAEKLQTPSEPPNGGLRAWLCVKNLLEHKSLIGFIMEL